MIKIKISGIQAQLLVCELEQKQKEYNLATRSKLLKTEVKEQARLRANRLGDILQIVNTEIDKGKI